MKKRKITACIVSLMCLMSLGLTGCGEENNTATAGTNAVPSTGTVTGNQSATVQTDSVNGSNNQESIADESSAVQNEFTLSKFLKSKDTLIVYESMSNTVGKDIAINGFYIISGGNISYYFGTDKMKTALLEQEKARKKFLEVNILDPNHDKLENEYKKKQEDYNKALEECSSMFSFGKLSKMTDDEILTLIKDNLNAEYENEKYDIAVFTDSSGNKVFKEKLLTDAHKLKHFHAGVGDDGKDIYTAVDEADEFVFNEKEAGKHRYPDYSEVYASTYYKMFNGLYIRLDDSEKETVILKDGFDSQDVLIDPEQKN